VQSCAVIGLVQSKKEIAGDYLVALKPVDSYKAYDMSINVIQGIAAFENGWFTSQTSANKYLLINYLDEKGESKFNYRISVNSHAQDLSLEQISDNELYLYTTLGEYNKEGASGLLRLKVLLPQKINGKRDMSKIKLIKDKELLLGLNNSTPTISENKKFFAIRSGNHVLVFTKENLLKGNYSSFISKFPIDQSQLKNGSTHLWFQGIAMKDNLIYCLTGNNSVDSPKLLYVYNLKGEVMKKLKIDKNAFAKQIGHKYEPEGLTFVGDDLYYTIMTKAKTGGNKKFLYKLDL
jgi:hypothetical protein